MKVRVTRRLTYVAWKSAELRKKSIMYFTHSWSPLLPAFGLVGDLVDIISYVKLGVGDWGLQILVDCQALSEW